MHDNPFGDDKFFNNVFAGRADLSVYDKAPMPVRMEGNVFLAGAKPSKHERALVVMPALDPGLKVVEKPDEFYLELSWEKALGDGTRRYRELSERPPSRTCRMSKPTASPSASTSITLAGRGTDRIRPPGHSTVRAQDLSP
jgi:hypothetical protein